jgi:hypothetical protein
MEKLVDKIFNNLLLDTFLIPIDPEINDILHIQSLFFNKFSINILI